MISVQDAVNQNLIEPIFIGDKKEIFKCAEQIKWDISKYKIISQCYKKADHFINLASNSLSIFKNTEEKKILENLTSFSIERSF